MHHGISYHYPVIILQSLPIFKLVLGLKQYNLQLRRCWRRSSYFKRCPSYWNFFIYLQEQHYFSRSVTIISCSINNVLNICNRYNIQVVCTHMLTKKRIECFCPVRQYQSIWMKTEIIPKMRIRCGKGSVIASSSTNLSADRSSSGSAGGSSISMVSVLELMTKTSKIVK